MNTHALTEALAGALGAHPTLERLFFASVELAVLALFLSLFIRLLRLRSARLISWLLLIALIKPIITLTVGHAVPVVVLKRAPAPTISPQRQADAATSRELIPAEGPATSSRVQASAAAVNPSAPDGAALGTSVPASWSWQEAVVRLWLGGAALFFAGYLLARLQLFRIKRNARAPSEGVAARFFEEARAINIRRRPGLLVSDTLESPALVGLFKPTVLLPSWLAATPDDPKFRWAVRHELTHWKWLDPLSIALRDLARVLFYFHPAAWWVGKKLIESTELACDRAMLRDASEATVYAEQLFQILREIRDRRRVPISGGLFATRTQIGKRISVLLDGSAIRTQRLTTISLAGIFSFALIALSLGGAVGDADSKPAEQERDTLVAQIEKLGGKITYDTSRPDQPILGIDFFIDDEHWWISPIPELKVTDDVLKRFAGLKDLRDLDLTDAQITDEGLKHLAGLVKLNKLSLLSTAITGAGLRHLKNATNITELTLWDTQLTDAGMAYLEQFQNLEVLYLNYNPKISDSGLRYLSGLRKLRHLHLFGSPITDAGLASLKELRNLEEIDLSGTKIGDDGLAHLKGLKHLKRLSLAQTPITDASFATITNFSRLMFLAIQKTRITTSGLANLAHFQEIEELRLGGPNQVNDRSMEHLKSLPRLKTVVLNEGAITAAGLAVLAQLPPVKITTRSYWSPFELNGPTIVDESIRHLMHFTGVKNLSLRNTQVSPEGLSQLKQVRDLEVLHMRGSNVTDSALVHLAALPHLRGLFLVNTRTSDEGLQHIGRAEKLQIVDLSGTKITDAGLRRLKPLSELTYLMLARTRTSDAGLDHLKAHSHLEHLDLSDTDISDDGLAQLADLQNLSSLILDGTGITDAGLKQIRRFAALRSVGLNNTKVTPAAADVLRKERPDLRQQTF